MSKNPPGHIAPRASYLSAHPGHHSGPRGSIERSLDRLALSWQATLNKQMTIVTPPELDTLRKAMESMHEAYELLRQYQHATKKAVPFAA